MELKIPKIHLRESSYNTPETIRSRIRRCPVPELESCITRRRSPMNRNCPRGKADHQRSNIIFHHKASPSSKFISSHPNNISPKHLARIVARTTNSESCLPLRVNHPWFSLFTKTRRVMVPRASATITSNRGIPANRNSGLCAWTLKGISSERIHVCLIQQATISTRVEGPQGNTQRDHPICAPIMQQVAHAPTVASLQQGPNPNTKPIRSSSLRALRNSLESVPTFKFMHRGPSPGFVPTFNFQHRGPSPGSVSTFNFPHRGSSPGGSSPGSVPTFHFQHRGLSSGSVPTFNFQHRVRPPGPSRLSISSTGFVPRVGPDFQFPTPGFVPWVRP
ncbi:hypothetical protein CRG98_011120 [Punica granatum]|uniref:Uncharacterized protein n=1 Tax=Punica granatum TaxID=22663 RepID=A0A2I0KIY7_PUNGR|nr:hypothetical protein CRG98_011120 [Punica granatum]